MAVRRFFFFQAEDGIRDDLVTGVQTCALPICTAELGLRLAARCTLASPTQAVFLTVPERIRAALDGASHWSELAALRQIGRASCRERGEISVVARSLKKKNRDKL